MFSTLLFKADALMLKGMIMANALFANNTTNTAGGGGGNWTIGNFLGALKDTAAHYVKLIILVIGVVMVGVGIYQIAKNLISGGKGQTNWVTTFLLIIIGGTFMVTSGWDFVKNFASGSGSTLSNMGQGQADTSGSYGDVQ